MILYNNKRDGLMFGSLRFRRRPNFKSEFDNALKILTFPYEDVKFNEGSVVLESPIKSLCLSALNCRGFSNHAHYMKYTYLRIFRYDFST